MRLKTTAQFIGQIMQALLFFLSDRAISLKWEVEQIALSIGKVRVFIAPPKCKALRFPRIWEFQRSFGYVVPWLKISN